MDVTSPTLLDVVPGREGKEPKKWIASQSKEWRDAVKWGTLDLAGSYRAVFREALPNAILVADPFHLIKLAAIGARGVYKAGPHLAGWRI